MSAFFVATVTIKNMDKFQDYGAQAGATFKAFGGEIMTKGKVEKALAGTSDHMAVAVVKFPDMSSLEAWYNSSEYQALIPLRNEAADMALTAYQAA